MPFKTHLRSKEMSAKKNRKEEGKKRTGPAKDEKIIIRK